MSKPYNRRIYFPAICCLAFALGLPMRGQPRPVAKAILKETNGQQLLPGVVVEKVEKNSEAEKAGLREGDVLLSWSRGDQQGKIESPFDVSWLETEQRPRGLVILYGTRGSQQQSWKPGPILWYLKVRPNFAGGYLAAYSESQRLSKKGKFAQAATRLTLAANQATSSEPAWLSACLFLRAAETWIRVGRWKSADASFRQAAAQALKNDVAVRVHLLTRSGDAYMRASQWHKAEEYYRQALSFATREGAENLSAARVLEHFGAMSLRRGEPVQTTEYYSQALQIQEKLIPNQFDLAITLNGLGQAAAESGDLSRAEEFSRKERLIEDRFALDN